MDRVDGGQHSRPSMSGQWWLREETGTGWHEETRRPPSCTRVHGEKRDMKQASRTFQLVFVLGKSLKPEVKFE